VRYELQVSKRHLPIVGLLGLVVVAAAGGSVYYYQFVVPHNASCGVSVHRLIFMTAIIQEMGGFNITNEVILTSGSAPTASGANPPSLVGLQYQNVTVTDHKTIIANLGDSVTIYVKSINANSTVQLSGATGHGFELDQYGILDTNIPWGNWHTMPTFTATAGGPFRYNCAQVCSAKHSDMVGTFSAGCSA